MYLKKIEESKTTENKQILETVICLLKNAIKINENSKTITSLIMQSIFGAISKAYFLQENFKQYIFYTKLQLNITNDIGLFLILFYCFYKLNF